MAATAQRVFPRGQVVEFYRPTAQPRGDALKLVPGLSSPVGAVTVAEDGSIDTGSLAPGSYVATAEVNGTRRFFFLNVHGEAPNE